jgi:hypothetical protein
MLLLLLIVFILFLSVIANKVIWKHEIIWEEMGINFLVLLLLLALFWQWSYQYKVKDYEILNGQVINKTKESVMCQHGYSCNCHKVCSRTSSRKSSSSRSCHTECDTCFEHLQDYDYVLQSNVGNINIPREDRQGIMIPLLFTQTSVGQAVVQKHQYDNLIKGSKNSLFNNNLNQDDDFDEFDNFNEKEIQLLPQYPDKIENLFHLNRVLWLSKNSLQPFSPQYLTQVNGYLADKLKITGYQKQVNVILVLADTQFYPQDFTFSLLKKWQGGKKNDVIVIMGIDVKSSSNTNKPQIAYVKVHSWSLHSLFDVQLRDELLDLNSNLNQNNQNNQTINLFKVIDIIDARLKTQYVQRSFQEFEYLRWEIIPSTWELIIFMVVSIALSLGIGFLFSKNQFRE